MNFTKYLIFVVTIILLLTFNTKVYADEKFCYYTGDSALKIDKSTLTKNKVKAYVDKVGHRYPGGKTEKILNWKYSVRFCDGDAPLSVNAYGGTDCPSTIAVVYQGGLIKQHFVYANPQSDINSWCSTLNSSAGGTCYVHYGTYQPNMTEEEYLDIIYGTGIDVPISSEPSGSDDQLCDIFGDVNNQDSIAYLVHTALSILRIIAIALIMVLGTIDMAKAVIASNEDEMKKAQKTFIKRLIVCVAIFLVPMIVDILMNLSDKLFDAAGIVKNCK